MVAGEMPDSNELNATIHDVGRWRRRVTNALGRANAQPVAFVIGSGLSKGVWSVDQILQHIKTEYQIEPKADSSAEAYGRAMDELAAVEDPDTVDRVIRLAVLAAVDLPNNDPDREHARRNDARVFRGACERIQQRKDCWKIAQGMTALAKAIRRIVDSRSVEQMAANGPVMVITTNFDPFVEIALSKEGLECESLSVVDGKYPKRSGKSVQVWHVHGAWWDVTMHTARSLRLKRDALETALHDCFNGAEVYVFGYGGWNDIVFDTVSTMMEGGQFSAAPKIIWTFYENDARERYAHVFQRFAGSFSSTRVAFFSGVDLHRELPSIVEMESVPDSSSVKAGWTKGTTGLRELLSDVQKECPPRHRADFDVFQSAEQVGERINLIRLVGLLCDILDSLQGAARENFALAAKRLVKRLALELVQESSADVKAVATCNGEIARVSVRTPLLVEILLARAHHRELELRPNARGAFGAFTLDVGESLEFESGNSIEGDVRTFEAMIWPQVIRNGEVYNQGRDREILLARLKLHEGDGHRMSVVLRAGASDRWSGVAKHITTVAFIETGASGDSGLLLDEHMLALRISDFLTKCPAMDG
jgi:hypothetical protein